MRVVIQRVSEARVVVDGEIIGEINKGYCILAGFEDADSIDDIQWICKKIVGLRIFNDENGKMNLSIKEVEGAVLLISQFTLHASTKKGNRPSFIKAAKPQLAEGLYQQTIKQLQFEGLKVETGRFAADMKVQLINDGPVTISIDSKAKE